MVSTTQLELLNFFLFNPKYGQFEGEEYKKILFYYPQDTNEDIQLKNAGLCEALIKFTESFKPDKPCQNFRTQRAKQFLFEPENDFWLVMTIGASNSVNYSESGSSEDSSNVIQDNVFEAVLRKTYRVYRTFCGTYMSNLESNSSETGLQLLKEKLKNFYNKYLLELKLTSCDILDVFQGISFLPLGKEPFLHVQSFINLLETKFKVIKYSAFLYNDQLVWSGINSEDMQVIYRYLISTLLPSDLNLEVEESCAPARKDSSFFSHGIFITSKSSLKDSAISIDKIPKVYLTNNGKDDEILYLVVYQILSATLCLFVSERDSLSIDFLKSLDSYLGPYLTNLVAEVSEHCVRYTSGSLSNETGPKVLYFNKLNLAQKTTMHVQNRKTVTTTVSSDILRMISDLNAEKSELNMCGEVMCLTLNDCWLVGRYSNSREFYAVFTQKKGSLIDITDEVKKLCGTQLKGIFFTE